MQKPTQQLQTHKSKPTSKLEPDKKKNHPRPKEEKANFVYQDNFFHQASIVDVTNNYSIH